MIPQCAQCLEYENSALKAKILMLSLKAAVAEKDATIKIQAAEIKRLEGDVATLNQMLDSLKGAKEKEE